jgi:hypothetical protein
MKRRTAIAAMFFGKSMISRALREVQVAALRLPFKSN